MGTRDYVLINIAVGFGELPNLNQEYQKLCKIVVR